MYQHFNNKYQNNGKFNIKMCNVIPYSLHKHTDQKSKYMGSQYWVKNKEREGEKENGREYLENLCLKARGQPKNVEKHIAMSRTVYGYNGKFCNNYGNNY